jgi:phage terminase large subunit-like protein
MVAGDWNAAYREELRAFPNGKYADQVDASSRAFMAVVEKHRKPVVFSKELLDAIGPPEPPRPPW